MCKCFRWKIHPHCICIHKIADICFYFCFFFQSWGGYETSVPKNMFFVENWHGNHFKQCNISPGTAYPSTRDQACLASIKSSESSNCQRITGLHFEVIQILGNGWATIQLWDACFCLSLKQLVRQLEEECETLSAQSQTAEMHSPSSIWVSWVDVALLWQRFHVYYPFSRPWLCISPGNCREYGFRTFHVTASGHFRLSSISFRKTSQPSLGN